MLDDTRQVSVAEQSKPEVEIYLPQLTQTSSFYKSAEGIAMDLAVRTERPSSSIVPELKELMRSASPELANTNFSTMDQIVEDSYGNQQLIARLLIVFGGAALLLCLSGIYGLLSQLVAQRTREIGVRMALGAGRGKVIGMVMRQASRMLTAGAFSVCHGVFHRKASSEVSLWRGPYDGWTLFALPSCYGGRLGCSVSSGAEAAAIDPMEALRTE